MPYLDSGTMTQGDSANTTINGNVISIFNPYYDSDYLTSPVLRVVQYDNNGNVIATGSLVLTVTLPTKE